MRSEAARAPTTTGISYFSPLPPTTLVNRNALRCSSGNPPRNCQRTSGWISVSFDTGLSMRVSSPALSRLARCSWKSAGAAVGFWLGMSRRPWRLVPAWRRLQRRSYSRLLRWGNGCMKSCNATSATTVITPNHERTHATHRFRRCRSAPAPQGGHPPADRPRPLQRRFQAGRPGLCRHGSLAACACPHHSRSTRPRLSRCRVCLQC